MIPLSKPHEITFLAADAIKKMLEELYNALLAIVVELLPDTLSFLHQLTVDHRTSRRRQAIVRLAKCTKQAISGILVRADIASIGSMLLTAFEYSWYPKQNLRKRIHVTHVPIIIHALQSQVLRARPATA